MSRTLTIDTSLIFFAVNMLLVLIGILTVYLLINNARAKKKDQRKEEYLDQHHDEWVRAISDGEEISVTLDRPEQVEWTIDIFLSHHNDYKDDVTRSRITELAEEHFSDYLADALGSRRQAARHYALAVIYQLNIDALGDQVASVSASTEFERALAAAITAREHRVGVSDAEGKFGTNAVKRSALDIIEAEKVGSPANRLRNILASHQPAREEAVSV
ncbi:hypothetical protein EAH68_09275 [Corynebacterium hylobatis]|uniref:Uncharacterized protein n=1 Tax=Corynebacterium hylobatis TaxID=1859290 RepID=A0A3S0C0P8_9CORY|nr:hypothetical protein [Corynebacterium hylobatis]RSZ62750.1 hypothetical protein EAH68_09275 [Corynebacterium hylobatis]